MPLWKGHRDRAKLLEKCTNSSLLLSFGLLNFINSMKFFLLSVLYYYFAKKEGQWDTFLIWIGNEITRFIHVIEPFRGIGNDRKEILDSKAILRLFLWKVRTGFYHGLVISPTADRQLRFINAVGSDSTSEKKINFSCDKRSIRRLKENRCLVDGTRDALDC